MVLHGVRISGGGVVRVLAEGALVGVGGLGVNGHSFVSRGERENTTQETRRSIRHTHVCVVLA